MTTPIIQALTSGTLLSGANSAAVNVSNHHRDAVQITMVATATSWTNLTLTLQGSMDGTNWFSLGKTLTADGQVSCIDRVPYYRIAATGGGAGTATYGLY